MALLKNYIVTLRIYLVQYFTVGKKVQIGKAALLASKFNFFQNTALILLRKRAKKITSTYLLITSPLSYPLVYGEVHRSLGNEKKHFQKTLIFFIALFYFKKSTVHFDIELFLQKVTHDKRQKFFCYSVSPIK